MYGLLGRTLVHSFSPQIHAMLGDYDYKLFEINPDALKDFFKKRNWDGINVTIPYKTAVIPYLDALAPTAEKIGSVNTIVADGNGRLIGHNTDYDGFLYLVQHSGLEIQNKKCLILGTGGASLTVKAVLQDLNAGEILCISRSGENNYQNISRHYDAEILINTTPVGMYPNNLHTPLSLEGFYNLQGVLDIIYNPAKTGLLLQAQAKGIPTANGLSMLVAQAKRASELFFDTKIPDCKTAAIYKKLTSDLRNIVLIGMPGSGKTTVGQALASMLGRELIDTDVRVVQKQQRSIPKIFAQHGEAYFRRCEHEAIREAGMQSGKIIATGGGAVLNAENYNPLAQNGTIVFLNRSVDALPRTGRPLSQNADLHEMYQKRLPLYRSFCDIELDANAPVNKIAAKIVTEMGML